MRLADTARISPDRSTSYFTGRTSPGVGDLALCNAGPMILDTYELDRRNPRKVRCNRPAGHDGRHAYSEHDQPRLAEWSDREAMA